MKATTKDEAVDGSKVLIRKCLGLSSYDSFLLIYDETTKHFPKIFDRASSSCRVQFQKHFVSTKLQHTSDAFTNNLVSKISDAHGILAALTADSSCDNFRIELTTKRRVEKNTVATMPGACVRILANAVNIDYKEIKQHCLDLTLPLIKGRNAKILTYDRKGREYKLKLKLAGLKRPPIQSYGIIPKLAWGNIPAGETFVAPIENSAEGEYLVNGSVGGEKVTYNEALLKFREGKLGRHYYLKSLKPVRYLLQLQSIGEKYKDQDCWSRIAELGIGVNKKIKRITGIEVLDEKMYGTLHIAIGHNVGYGGENDCPSFHCDITTQNPSLIIDRAYIINRGLHVYEIKNYQDNYQNYRGPTKYCWDPNLHNVNIDHDSYELINRELFVKYVTPSGRITIYPIGTSDTAKAAYTLIKLADNRNTIEINFLKKNMKIRDDYFYNLLSILWLNDIVYP